MRSKAPLALMEQAVMVLVFALAAALCLRVFVWSDRASARSVDRDRAVIEAQNAAEILKHEGEKGGDLDAVLAAAAEELGGGCQGESQALAVYYDGDWKPVPAEGSYRLEAREAPGDIPGLETVHVWVSDRDGEDVLFELDVAWQTEVAG